MTDSTPPDDATPVPDGRNRTDDPDRADGRADAPDQPGGDRRGGNKPGAPGNDEPMTDSTDGGLEGGDPGVEE